MKDISKFTEADLKEYVEKICTPEKIFQVITSRPADSISRNTSGNKAHEL